MASNCEYPSSNIYKWGNNYTKLNPFLYTNETEMEPKFNTLFKGPNNEYLNKYFILFECEECRRNKIICHKYFILCLPHSCDVKWILSHTTSLDDDPLRNSSIY